MVLVHCNLAAGSMTFNGEDAWWLQLGCLVAQCVCVCGGGGHCAYGRWCEQHASCPHALPAQPAHQPGCAGASGRNDWPPALAQSCGWWGSWGGNRWSLAGEGGGGRLDFHMWEPFRSQGGAGGAGGLHCTGTWSIRRLLWFRNQPSTSCAFLVHSSEHGVAQGRMMTQPIMRCAVLSHVIGRQTLFPIAAPRLRVQHSTIHVTALHPAHTSYTSSISDLLPPMAEHEYTVALWWVLTPDGCRDGPAFLRKPFQLPPRHPPLPPTPRPACRVAPLACRRTLSSCPCA